MRVLLLIVASYLLGSVPSSHVAGRLAGVDLRRRGSGNLGGTNVLRVLGPRAAIPVIVTDVAKGFAPVWFFPVWDGVGTPWLALAYGLAAVAGHVWSVFVGFEGGKGVATSGGVLLALAPLAVLLGALVWGGLVLLTRTASVASLGAATSMPLIAYLTDAPPETVAFAAGLCLFIWWTHRDNLRRLRRGEELDVAGPPGPGPGEEGGREPDAGGTG